MSLYGLLFGKNSQANILLDMLELDTKYPTGRFRDIYLNKKGTKIILYTRNGGGNREHPDYEETEEGSDCKCTGCIMTYQLPEHPNYIEDYDDDVDSTYAYVKFSVPEQHKEKCRQMATGEDPVSVSEKFQTLKF
jgi:hypothetical protein